MSQRGTARLARIGLMMVLGLWMLVTSRANASTGELYGYGSRASAMGNTLLGGSTEAFATFYNPAANSAHAGLQLSFALSFEKPNFKEIKSVVVKNSATSSELNEVIGDVDTTSYNDHLGQAIAASVNLGEKFKNLTFGATAFMPIARVAYLDSNDPFLPDYLQYRARTQRPQIYGSLSANPLKDLYLAMGVSISTNLSAQNNVSISGNDRQLSNMRFASTIKPGAAPYFSAYATPGKYEFSGVVRLQNRYKVSIDTNAHTFIFGNTNDLALVINSSSTILYDPLELDFGVGYHLDSTFITLEADWLQYAAFESPVLAVTNIASGPAIRNSVSSLPPMRNIIIPKAAVEHDLESCKLRAGYMFRPSPIKDNAGTGNLVDPDRHTFTAGIGFDLKKVHVTEKPIFLDLHFQYHVLATKHIEKSPNNESGNPAQRKIGAPGYDIGGSIYGGGFSLSMSF